MYNNAIGMHLAKLMEQKGISRVELSKRLEKYNVFLTEEELREIEDGIREVNDVEVWGISRALGVTADVLILGEE